MERGSSKKRGSIIEDALTDDFLDSIVAPTMQQEVMTLPPISNVDSNFEEMAGFLVARGLGEFVLHFKEYGVTSMDDLHEVPDQVQHPWRTRMQDLCETAKCGVGDHICLCRERQPAISDRGPNRLNHRCLWHATTRTGQDKQGGASLRAWRGRRKIGVCRRPRYAQRLLRT